MKIFKLLQNISHFHFALLSTVACLKLTYKPLMIATDQTGKNALRGKALCYCLQSAQFSAKFEIIRAEFHVNQL